MKLNFLEGGEKSDMVCTSFLMNKNADNRNEQMKWIMSCTSEDRCRFFGEEGGFALWILIRLNRFWLTTLNHCIPKRAISSSLKWVPHCCLPSEAGKHGPNRPGCCDVCLYDVWLITKSVCRVCSHPLWSHVKELCAGGVKTESSIHVCLTWQHASLSVLVLFRYCCNVSCVLSLGPILG